MTLRLAMCQPGQRAGITLARRTRVLREQNTALNAAIDRALGASGV